MPRQEVFTGRRSTDTAGRPHHQFQNTPVAKPYYVQATATRGQVDILDRTGAAVASGVDVDDLLYSLYAAGTHIYSELHRRAAAYAAVTGATASVAVTHSDHQAPQLTASALTVEDLGQFADAVLKCSGYQDRDLAQRRQALADGRTN